LPASQTCVSEHSVAQSPHRVGSLETSTHVPSQSSKPGAHSTPQLPSSQTATPPADAGQASPQAPQLVTSVAMSTQLAPHGT
jgi:hypothetical protein